MNAEHGFLAIVGVERRRFSGGVTNNEMPGAQILLKTPTMAEIINVNFLLI
jgi:hypothetical protein